MSFKWVEDGAFDALPQPDFEALQRHRKGFAVIDLETTGLSVGADRIVEIGVVLLDEDFTPTHSIETLINPSQQMKATFVHKISHAAVQQSPSFEILSVSLFALLNGRTVVAHNVGFENKFLTAEFRRAGIFNPKFTHPVNFLDTMTVAPRQLVGIGRGLGALTKAVGIEIEAPHEALPDALATAKLLNLLGPTDVHHNIPGRVYESARRRYDMSHQRRSVNYGLSLWQGRQRP